MKTNILAAILVVILGVGTLGGSSAKSFVGPNATLSTPLPGNVAEVNAKGPVWACPPFCGSITVRGSSVRSLFIPQEGLTANGPLLLCPPYCVSPITVGGSSVKSLPISEGSTAGGPLPLCPPYCVSPITVGDSSVNLPIPQEGLTAGKGPLPLCPPKCGSAIPVGGSSVKSLPVPQKGSTVVAESVPTASTPPGYIPDIDASGPGPLPPPLPPPYCVFDMK
jgi:hypothetical protein